MPRRWLVLLVIAGVGMRLSLLVLAPRWGYPWDQFGNTAMGLAAERHGVLRVYGLAADDVPHVSGIVVGPDGVPGTAERRTGEPPNYPPLAMLLLWGQAWLSAKLWSPLEVNTLGPRLVAAIAPGICELLVVAGVAALVRALGAPRRAVWLAAGVCWLFPPLAMNVWLWGQTDAVPLASMVAAVVCLARGRWRAAGLCTALAVLLKPQGVLVVVPAFFAASVAAPPSVVARRLGELLGAAGLSTLVLSAPWMAVSGLAWVRRCYLASAAMYPWATLHAFNVWYLDALLGGRVADSRAALAGLSRDAWGALLLLAAGVGATTLCRRGTSPARATATFAALWLWSAFLFPTRVHERYVLYCAPFAIAAAAVRPRLWASVVGLAVVGIGAHSWNVWQRSPHPAVEWMLTATSLASFAWALVAVSEERA